MVIKLTFVQGGKGDMGTEGEQGVRGDPGIKGKDGPPGDPGLTGVRVSDAKYCIHVLLYGVAFKIIAVCLEASKAQNIYNSFYLCATHCATAWHNILIFYKLF